MLDRTRQGSRVDRDRWPGLGSTENIFPWELLGLGSEASRPRDRLLHTQAASRCVCTRAVLPVRQDPSLLRLRRPPDRASCYWGQTRLCSWAPRLWDILVSDTEERMCFNSENPTQLASPEPHGVSGRCKVQLWAAPSAPFLCTVPPRSVHPSPTFSFTLPHSSRLEAPG